MTVTKEKVVGLFQAISTLQQEPKLKTRLIYALKKNMDKINPEIEALKTISPEAKTKEYQDKTMVLINEFAKKDENGEVIYVGERSVNIPDENQEAFNVKQKEINDEYVPILNDLNKVWDETLKKKWILIFIYSAWIFYQKKFHQNILIHWKYYLERRINEQYL